MRKILFGILLMLFLVKSGEALMIDVPNNSFFPEKNQLNRICKVSNQTNRIRAVELKIQQRSYDINNKEILTDTNDFLIYPNKLLLKPGETVISTISWLGDLNPIKELAYRVVTEEILIPKSGKFEDKVLEKEQGISLSLNFQYKFLNSIYIVPLRAYSDVIIEKYEILPDNQFALFLKNKGNLHQILLNMKLEFIGKNIKVSKKYIQDEIGRVNILAGERRRIVLKFPDKINETNIVKINILNIEG